MGVFGKAKSNISFIANILDPLQGLSFDEMMDGVEGKGLWYKEEIIARDENELKHYQSRLDKETKELYFVKVYRNGEAETYLCDKSLFLNTYNKMKSRSL